MHSFTQALHCVRTNESLPKTNFVNSVDSYRFLSSFYVRLSTEKHEEIGRNLQNLTNLFWSRCPILHLYWHGLDTVRKSSIRLGRGTFMLLRLCLQPETVPCRVSSEPAAPAACTITGADPAQLYKRHPMRA